MLIFLLPLLRRTSKGALGGDARQPASQSSGSTKRLTKEKKKKCGRREERKLGGREHTDNAWLGASPSSRSTGTERTTGHRRALSTAPVYRRLTPKHGGEAEAALAQQLSATRLDPTLLIRRGHDTQFRGSPYRCAQPLLPSRTCEVSFTRKWEDSRRVNRTEASFQPL